ncbi:MAG: hypothetical protein PHW04_18445, partial [Candidatus Wallbacteria bacterium]|nr:hypothetical protein [Candidatus Wallbacteria bacterium]
MKKILIYVVFLVPLLVSAANIPGEIAQLIKTSLDATDVKSVRSTMVQHFQTLRLIDADCKWVAPELAAISDRLLARDLTMSQVKSFVDQAADLAEKNVYLAAFFARAQQEDFSGLAGKVSQIGKQEFPRLVAYALALDRLTGAMKDDWRLLEICRKIWQKHGSDEHITGNMGWFDWAKLESVEMGIDGFIKYHKSEVVPQDFMRRLLPLNIMEAVAVDMQLGHYGNANTGRILAKYPPGNSKPNFKTQEGPTAFSADGKAILLNMAFPQKWADLYSTWNLAFVSHYGCFPYVMVKLLIPQVNDYADCPSGYIYNRALALYAHLYFAFFGRVDAAASGAQAPDLSDEKLTRLWGEVNGECAQQYE